MHQYYTYDDAGNVLNLRDEPTAEHLQADVQCFTYDHMRRMTGVWTPDATGEEACADRPSIAVSGKAALHDPANIPIGSRIFDTSSRPFDSEVKISEPTPEA
ncbi:hypothetical protein ACFW4K_02665 [Nocardiopsis alba]|uniref:hypothetical protein n=1 Tax=Nocardiopsis alba TaxID=53437 RepID=UPI0033DFA88E